MIIVRTFLIVSFALWHLDGLEAQSTEDVKIEAIDIDAAADKAAEMAEMIARNPPKEIEEIDWEKQEALIATLSTNPPNLSKARLPKGYKIGRCLLVVDGKTRISGPCAYIIYKGGEFHIDGPRQVFRGIDYPNNEMTPHDLSTDWWANVFKDGVVIDGEYKVGKGPWTGYANEEPSARKGDGSRWGKLTRSGACYSNSANPPPRDEHQQSVKVCLWKK